MCVLPLAAENIIAVKVVNILSTLEFSDLKCYTGHYKPKDMEKKEGAVNRDEMNDIIGD